MKGATKLANKKIIMSVTASAAIASAIFAADEAVAATHKVQSGDTLWSIAQKYNTTVTHLKSINSLSTDVIIPNQTIKTSKSSKSSSKSGSKTTSSSSKSTTSNSKSTYTVKAGDTLSGIAAKHKVSLSNLMKWNDLDTTLIFPGNVFVVSKNGGKTSNSSSSGSKGSSGGSSATSSSSSSGKSSTYTVKSGDTLSHIASRQGVSVANLKKWNNLSSDLIRVGQKLSIKGGSSGSSSSSGSASSGSGSSASTKTYTVKSGDSLSKIASQNGVTVAKLKSWNSLKSDTIYIGQKLSINGKASGSTGSAGSSNSGGSSSGGTSSGGSADVSYNVNKLVNEAQKHLGVPYVWGGQSTSGFDCSGYIHYVYNKAGLKSGRTNTEGYYSRSYYVNNPQVGDLVFFEGTYKAGISHMGIYLGNNEFIHAGTSTGVTITNLNNPYWSKHFDGFKRFY